MTCEVMVPVGGDDPHRGNALGIVYSYFADYFPEFFPYRVRLVEGADVSKGDALNAAVAASTADVLIMNDADSLVAPHQLAQAIRLASTEPGLVFAYTRYRRIDQETTEKMRNAVDVFNVRDDQVEWQKTMSGSHGCVAIRRECWDTAGGLDPVFGMAGYEDLAFNTVCEAFWPSRRVAGDLYHLWHPRGWDADPAREQANLARYRDQYLAAWGDQERLLEVRANG